MNSSIGLIVIIAFAILILLVLIYQVAQLSEEKDEKWKAKIQSKLKSDSKRLKANDVNTLRYLVVDTDKLLDHALKGRNVKGKTLGERLKNARHLYSKAKYNKVWEAHKVRNKIVHDFDYRISADKLKNIILILGLE